MICSTYDAAVSCNIIGDFSSDFVELTIAICTSVAVPSKHVGDLAYLLESIFDDPQLDIIVPLFKKFDFQGTFLNGLMVEDADPTWGTRRNSLYFLLELAKCKSYGLWSKCPLSKAVYSRNCGSRWVDIDYGHFLLLNLATSSIFWPPTIFKHAVNRALTSLQSCDFFFARAFIAFATLQ